MAKKIFVNLPVADLQKAKDFYTAIGFVNNPAYSDETAAYMELTDEINVMFLSHAKFLELTNKAVAQLNGSLSVYHSLSVDSAEEMNTMLSNAIAAGGVEYGEAEDLGFMQSRNFVDLDGHIWVIVYVDISKFPQQ